MRTRTGAAIGIAALCGLIAACEKPTYHDQGLEEQGLENPFSKVVFQVHDAYKANPPECVAVLPFEIGPGEEEADPEAAPEAEGEGSAEPAAEPPTEVATDEQGNPLTGDVTAEEAEAVRRAFYAHLSPQGKRDVEIPRIDFVLNRIPDEHRQDLVTVASNLNCDSVIVGRVTEYGAQFVGVYSRIGVGADLKMVRAEDGAVLWEGRHLAQSHGGSVPLSPIGLAMGILSAAFNLDEEQELRVVDDLTRRLVKTIPDDRLSVLDTPFTTVKVMPRRGDEGAKVAGAGAGAGGDAAQPAPADVAGDVGVGLTTVADTVVLSSEHLGPVEDAAAARAFIESLAAEPREQRVSALVEAAESYRFDDEGTELVHRTLIEWAPDDPSHSMRFAEHLVGKGDYDGALQVAEQSLAAHRDDHAMHYLKARVQIKLGQLDAADQSIVQAVALSDNEPSYLNGLGYVNSLRGNAERALAAYRMALDRDPANGYAYYNMGVTLYNLEDIPGAAEAFYGAGLAYLKTGDYGQAEKALEDLKDLAAQGIDAGEEIKTLEDALESLTRGVS